MLYSKRIHIFIIFLSLIFFVSLVQAKANPRVLVLATGGTIAGQANGNSATGYTAGQITIDKILQDLPGLDSSGIIIKHEQIANISSQDMDYVVWKKLALRILQAVKNNEADAFVVTHGTDTMEETAFFLDQVLSIDNPVIFTGSIRPASHLSADGPQNLVDAIKTAANVDSFGRGVLIVFGNKVIEARYAVKGSNVEMTSFSANFGGPVGFVDDLGVHYYSIGRGRGKCVPFRVDLNNVDKLPKVDIVTAYAGLEGEVIRNSQRNGAKGIIIAGVGDGNMPADCLVACKEASSQGVLVIRSTRVFNGYTHRNHEFKDEDYGTYASFDLSPQKARIITQLLILEGINDPVLIQKAFCGEVPGHLRFIED